MEAFVRGGDRAGLTDDTPFTRTPPKPKTHERKATMCDPPIFVKLAVNFSKLLLLVSLNYLFKTLNGKVLKLWGEGVVVC